MLGLVSSVSWRGKIQMYMIVGKKNVVLNIVFVKIILLLL